MGLLFSEGALDQALWHFFFLSFSSNFWFAFFSSWSIKILGFYSFPGFKFGSDLLSIMLLRLVVRQRRLLSNNWFENT
jgi:hypothetical protein